MTKIRKNCSSSSPNLIKASKHNNKTNNFTKLLQNCNITLFLLINYEKNIFGAVFLTDQNEEYKYSAALSIFFKP